ncbi:MULTISPECIES: hypothetical protein [unclassified Ensifer]|uniref:hypothetical protein n=1 Tax=unclassified Ensifer TaxID=2633371 RepID=UPI0012E7A4DB|nr:MULTISPECIES: hypothetical protein [unclassified Ensifer]
MSILKPLHRKKRGRLNGVARKDLIGGVSIGWATPSGEFFLPVAIYWHFAGDGELSYRDQPPACVETAPHEGLRHGLLSTAAAGIDASDLNIRTCTIFSQAAVRRAKDDAYQTRRANYQGRRRKCGCKARA